MMAKIDVTALGELLVDFTPYGTGESGNEVFEANPGGAPCNVLAQLSKLGKSTSFIGKVGNDAFGKNLAARLSQIGIGADGLCVSPDAHTTLAFVHLSPEGERSFSFVRNESADVRLEPEEVDERMISRSSFFHCGTLLMTREPGRSATLKALDCAKQAGAIISVDPNLRESLWTDLDDARTAMLQVMAYADVIKISDNELAFLYGGADAKDNAGKLFRELRPRIVFATCGKDGAYLITHNGCWWHRCFLEVRTVDTTGAGDAFAGAALSRLLDVGFPACEEQAMDILRFSSAAAALVTTRKGAMLAMPTLAEINQLLERDKT